LQNFRTIYEWISIFIKEIFFEFIPCCSRAGRGERGDPLGGESVARLDEPRQQPQRAGGDARGAPQAPQRRPHRSRRPRRGPQRPQHAQSAQDAEDGRLGRRRPQRPDLGEGGRRGAVRGRREDQGVPPEERHGRHLSRTCWSFGER
jgi:hypothetical protein